MSLSSWQGPPIASLWLDALLATPTDTEVQSPSCLPPAVLTECPWGATAFVPAKAQESCGITCPWDDEYNVYDYTINACRKKLANGQAFIGTRSKDLQRCEYVDAGQVFRSTAPGEPFDCICKSKDQWWLEWHPSLSCMDGGGAAIRDAAPPACRVWDSPTGTFGWGWMRASLDGTRGTCFYTTPGDPGVAKNAVLQRGDDYSLVEVLCKTSELMAIGMHGG